MIASSRSRSIASTSLAELGRDELPRTPELFPVLRDTDIESLASQPWLIDGVLPATSFAALVGPPSSAKTFAALDLAFHVAIGDKWCGRDVMQGDVVYVAAEGVGGLQSKVRAWKSEYSQRTVDTMFFIPVAVQLLDPNEVSRLVTTIREFELEPKLIILDTLARCFVGGDENSAAMMGEALQSVTRIQGETGSAVLLVHHTRKGDSVERGSGALRGALDAMISMRKDGSRVTISCGKMKDAEEFSDISLTLIESETSCVLQLALPEPDESELDGTAHSILELLEDGGLKHGVWKLAAKELGIAKTSFERARKQLLNLGLIFKAGDGCWTASETPQEPDGTNSTRSFRTGTVAPHGGLSNVELESQRPTARCFL